MCGCMVASRDQVEPGRGCGGGRGWLPGTTMSGPAP
jgi:hypothetical protein